MIAAFISRLLQHKKINTTAPVQLNEKATLFKREIQDNVYDKAEINYSKTCG